MSTVRFLTAPARTADGGRKYAERELISIPLDGGIHTVTRLATEADRKRYAVEYAAFKGVLVPPTPPDVKKGRTPLKG